MTSQAHAAAALALLQAHPNLTVYDGKVGGDPPYVLVYTFRLLPSGLVAPDRIKLTGTSQVVDMRLYCHSVGATAEAARRVSDFVAASLLDVTPTVAGRRCNPIRHEDASSTDREEQTLQPHFDQVDVYGFWSVPE